MATLHQLLDHQCLIRVTDKSESNFVLAFTYHGLEVDASLLLASEDDVGRLLVQPDAEALQFVLQLLFVLQRLQTVQHDEDEGAGARHSDHLATATFAVLGALDDARQVQQLQARWYGRSGVRPEPYLD